MKRLSLAALLLMLVLLPAVGDTSARSAVGSGTTLYVQKVLVAGPGSVTIGDIVRTAGDVPPEAREALARSVAVVADGIVYVPASSYRQDLQAAFGAAAIIVGARTAVIPRGSAAEGQAWLVDRLVDWLTSQHLLGESTVAIGISQLSTRGTPPLDGSPVFRAIRSGSGGTDVTVSLSSSDGSISGLFSIPAATAVAADGVKAGTPVSVVFRKGLITIEMPGRTLAAASPGGTVGVTLTESQKSFTGVLVDGKAVDVDLP